MIPYMYGGTILLVNLSEGKVSKEPTTSYSGAFLGGRGINIKLLYDGVPPEVDPLDPASFLIFGTGPLCGTPIPASRVEVTAKSPETGFLGSSNFGGFFGPELKFAGYDNIIITGKSDKPVYLWIYNDEVEIRDASYLWGKDTYQTQEIIHSEINPDVQIACIGPAGENLVRFATIQHGFGQGAGRTGMGCVMGSKNLKAIAVRGTKGVYLAKPEKYLSIVAELQNKLINCLVLRMRQQRGYSVEIDLYRSLGVYGTAGRKTESNITKPVFVSDLISKYKPKKAGCFGCVVQCKDLYPTKAKRGGAISCTFYSTPSYVLKDLDLDLMLESDLLAQRYGIDIVSSLEIIAWLMELYENGIITAKDSDGIIMEKGSRQAIIGILEKIVYRKDFGNVLADGILAAAGKIGRGAKDYANQVKGLPLHAEFTPDELVPVKGSALATVVSSRGDMVRARTTGQEEEATKVLASLHEQIHGVKKDGELIEAARQRSKYITGTEKAFVADEYEGKPELVAYSEDTYIVNDCLGVCKCCNFFSGYHAFDENYEAALFSAGSGVDTNADMLFRFARKVKNLERAYCTREGMTRDMDSLPKRFMDHTIQEGIHKDSVLETNRFELMKDKYYALRGWDVATGIPTQKTLEQYGLGYVAQDLEERRNKLPDK
jgi:aldehyde:ferredoxin oxidoreductase